jgi:hypothetical protein
LGHEFDIGPVHFLLGQVSGELHSKHDLKLSVILKFFSSISLKPAIEKN